MVGCGERGTDREGLVADLDGRHRRAGLGEDQQREAGHAPLCFILAGSNVRMAANGPARTRGVLMEDPPEHQRAGRAAAKRPASLTNPPNMPKPDA